MQTATHYPLVLRRGHLFIEVQGQHWLVDTGAMASLGSGSSVTVAGATVRLGQRYLRSSLDQIRAMVDVPEMAGLLGMDLLKQFDLLFDLPMGRLMMTPAETAALSFRRGGDLLPISSGGIPAVRARVGGALSRFWIDTGAQFSYFQHPIILHRYPRGRIGTDFFPSFGVFAAQLYQLPVHFGSTRVTLQMGVLPDAIAGMLTSRRIDGIVGADLFADRQVGLCSFTQTLFVGAREPFWRRLVA